MRANNKVKFNLIKKIQVLTIRVVLAQIMKKSRIINLQKAKNNKNFSKLKNKAKNIFIKKPLNTSSS
jgi:hypothetical protein